MSEPLVLDCYSMNIDNIPTIPEQEEMKRRMIVYLDWIADERNRSAGREHNGTLRWDENLVFGEWWYLTGMASATAYVKSTKSSEEEIQDFFSQCSIFSDAETAAIIEYTDVMGPAAEEEARIYELDLDYDANPIADLDMLFSSSEWMAMHHAAKKALKVFKNDTNT